MRRDEAIAAIQQCVPQLRALGVRTLHLFGSVARDEASETSDVDVLVDLEEPTFDRYFDVKFLLEDRLGVRVDVVTRTGLEPRARRTVDEEAIRVA